MRTPRLAAPRDPMPDMTAMVDLVMCILIFFMLGSTFVQAGWFIPGAMPAAGIGIGPGDATPDSKVNLTLEIRSVAPGVLIAVSGGQAIPAPGKAPTDSAGLNAWMTEYMKRVTAELRRIKAAGAGAVRVVLRPDGGVEYEHLVRIFGAVVDGGFEEIAFAVVPR